MFSIKSIRLQTCFLLVAFLFCAPSPGPAAGLSDLLGKKEINEEERQETIERIQSIQEKLKLLQDKLRVLERRKAVKEAAQKAEETGQQLPATPVQINWKAFNGTNFDQGDYGLYTYLLFNGDQEDLAAIGLLEDFILTIETLPANDIPPALANQFLVPVEKPQSLIKLGRQPYNFELNAAYMKRFNISKALPMGPVLVSSRKPVDPYATGSTPDFIAVAFGQQSPEESAKLAGVWHRQEKTATVITDHAVSELFWELIDGIGPVQVTRNKQNVTVALPQ